MKFCVLCSLGVGDLVVLHIVSHHLKKMGHEVVTITPHRFGKWLEGYQFADAPEPCDALFLQYDNTERTFDIRQHGVLGVPPEKIYTFYGDYKLSKHGPLRPQLDFAADPNHTIVDNIVASLKTLFAIDANSENGFRAPPEWTHRRHAKRIAIHTTSGDPFRNWPEKKFHQFAEWAHATGLDPVFLPQFPSLEELTTFLYESGYFLGNDSGPGHIASCLHIPHLIIGREERHMRHWRPGWGHGTVITPPKWVPNWKGMRMREKYWSSFISTNSVINAFKTIVLRNK